MHDPVTPMQHGCFPLSHTHTRHVPNMYFAPTLLGHSSEWKYVEWKYVQTLISLTLNFIIYFKLSHLMYKMSLPSFGCIYIADKLYLRTLGFTNLMYQYLYTCPYLCSCYIEYHQWMCYGHYQTRQ